LGEKSHNSTHITDSENFLAPKFITFSYVIKQEEIFTSRLIQYISNFLWIGGAVINLQNYSTNGLSKGLDLIHANELQQMMELHLA